MTELYVKVKTEQDSFNLETGHMIKADLIEKPVNGRANTELIRKLNQIIGKDVGLIEGHKSTRKKIKVDCSKEEVLKKVKEWEKQQ